MTKILPAVNAFIFSEHSFLLTYWFFHNLVRIQPKKAGIYENMIILGNIQGYDKKLAKTPPTRSCWKLQVFSLDHLINCLHGGV